MRLAGRRGASQAVPGRMPDAHGGSRQALSAGLALGAATFRERRSEMMASANKAEFVWMDGKVVPWGEATIHVSSEAVLRGASIFEGVRAYWSAKEEEL